MFRNTFCPDKCLCFLVGKSHPMLLQGWLWDIGYPICYDLPQFTTVCHYSSLFKTVCHYSHYSRLFTLFVLFTIFTIQDYSLFAIHDYSGFRDTQACWTWDTSRIAFEGPFAPNQSKPFHLLNQLISGPKKWQKNFEAIYRTTIHTIRWKCRSVKVVKRWFQHWFDSWSDYIKCKYFAGKPVATKNLGLCFAANEKFYWHFLVTTFFHLPIEKKTFSRQLAPARKS